MQMLMISHRYYHFGVVKALLDAGLLPKVVTGTSGGALVAALLCTRTNEELKQILVPELAHKITACHDDTWVSDTTIARIERINTNPLHRLGCNGGRKPERGSIVSTGRGGVAGLPGGV